MLDSMYKTTVYNLALFLLMVKTNVGFTVVGEFVIPSEACVYISEALNRIKRGMQDADLDWTAKEWMVDDSAAEFNAIKEVFLGNFTRIGMQ